MKIIGGYRLDVNEGYDFFATNWPTRHHLVGQLPAYETRHLAPLGSPLFKVPALIRAAKGVQ